MGENAQRLKRAEKRSGEMPILKFSGMLLIIMAGWAIGFTIAKKFHQRPLQLRAFQSSLMMLQTEISYAATPLPEALNRVAGRCEPPIQDFYLAVVKQLNSGQGLTADEAWGSTLLDWQRISALQSGDISILLNLGGTLGASDREEQVKHLLLAQEQLRQAEIKAEVERSKNETLWKYAGVLIALLIVIVLY
jgi:stage III sporulation protein AB